MGIRKTVKTATLFALGLAGFLIGDNSQLHAQNGFSLDRPALLTYVPQNSNREQERKVPENSADQKKSNKLNTSYYPDTNQPQTNLKFTLSEPLDQKSLPEIIKSIGSDRTENAFYSAELRVNDTFTYFARNPALVDKPEKFYADRGVNLFRRTILRSAGDYAEDNLELPKAGKVLLESTVGYEKGKIVPFFASPTEGSPGDSYTRARGFDGGIRNILSDNPNVFLTYKDRIQAEVAVRGPSLTIRNPIGIDGGTLTSVVGINYDDFKTLRFGGALNYDMNDHFRARLQMSAAQADLTEGKKMVEQIIATLEYRF